MSLSSSGLTLISCPAPINSLLLVLSLQLGLNLLGLTHTKTRHERRKATGKVGTGVLVEESGMRYGNRE